MNSYDNNINILSPLRQAAGGTAIVTLVFGIIITALLTISLYHYTVTDPGRALELEELKNSYKQQPANIQLARQIHDLDIQIRRDQFARLFFLQHGTVLLVIDLTVFIAAVLLRTQHLRIPSLPESTVDRKKEQIRHALNIRTAVTLTTITLCAIGLYLAQHPINKPIQISAAADSQQSPDLPSYSTFADTLKQWPAFRGAEGSGVCTFADIPDDWDGPEKRNILWKSTISLAGHNSPVIWDNRIFLSGATAETHRIFCYDLNTGNLLWTGDITIPDDPARDDMYIMDDTGYAAPTVVTDGFRVCAMFAGGDLGCFSVDGAKLWEQHLGIPESAYGYAASLAAFEKNVIIQFDVSYDTDKSKLIALDWTTGKTAWQTPRPVPNSWTSPTVVQIGQTQQLLTSGSPWIITYDPATGRELYRADCLAGDVAPTQIYTLGKIIGLEPYNTIVAVNTEAAVGDVTQTHIAWRTSSSIPDICSPVSNGTLIWTLTSDGTLTAFDVADGTEVYVQSLNMEFNASPSIVGNTLYLLSVKGTMLLAETDREYKEIKRLELGEKCHASPAFAPGKIVLRAENSLYCIGTTQ